MFRSERLTLGITVSAVWLIIGTMLSRHLSSSLDWLRAGTLAFASPFVVTGGYLLSACFLLAALHKPFAPARVGLWQVADEFSLHLGFGTGPIAFTGKEALGWWLIPVGILLGSCGVLGMTKLATAVVGWECRFWSSHVGQYGRLPDPAGWIRAKWIGCIEVGLVAGLLVADWMGLVPFSNTPFLLVLAWISLRARKLRWRSVGLVQPDSWTRTIALGIVAGLALECFSLLITEPLISWATGIAPDRSDFRSVVGNPVMLGTAMALNWTLAAFGEEMTWRGYLFNRFKDFFSSNGRGQFVCLCITSALFGVAHGESQGLGGVLEEGFAGFVLGLMYLGSRRRLALPIIAHGASNTLALVMIFYNRYPGLWRPPSD
jgi:membrane protease YdiL (CAAX protease family)